PPTPSLVDAGTDSGVLKSTDGGSTWNATDSPLPPPTDTAPPDTSITSAIDGNGAAVPDQATTPSTSLTLTFTGADDRGVARFECQLDGAGFNGCTSPWARTGLAPGRHTFEVRAVDTSNNVDPIPARLAWTIDAPPDTRITSAADDSGAAMPDQGITLSRPMTMTFTGSDDRGV